MKYGKLWIVYLSVIWVTSCSATQTTDTPSSVGNATSVNTEPVVPEYISQLVFKFSSDIEPTIGSNAASTLYLQTWSTMRRAGPDIPSDTDLGKGITRWADQPVVSMTHKEAAERAVRSLSQIALWGTAERYSSGLILKSFITVPDDARSGGVLKAGWSIDYGEKKYPIHFPATEVEWGAIVLDEGSIAELERPFGIPIYKDRESDVTIGYMTGAVRALMFDVGAAKVVDAGKSGWVRYPAIGGRNRSTVASAVGGITRMMRGDYSGAIGLFTQIIESNGALRLSNEIDIRLLRGICIELQGKSGLADFEYAYQHNPFSNAVIEHLLGGLLSSNNKSSLADTNKRARAVLFQSSTFLNPNSAIGQLAAEVF